jgi:PPOX class probable F420-dependent enzyme
MRMERALCHELLSCSEHGVLATVHPERGADAVPACFAVSGDLLAVPVDRVKAKESTDLQRIRNLEQDPRATLLCDQWDAEDWSRLWWVRASLVCLSSAPRDPTSLEAVLRDKYPPYRGVAFASLIIFRIAKLTGWAATEHAVTGTES